MGILVAQVARPCCRFATPLAVAWVALPGGLLLVLLPLLWLLLWLRLLHLLWRLLLLRLLLRFGFEGGYWVSFVVRIAMRLLRIVGIRH